MKLIDMLVEELPKRGGWPDDSDEMCQSQVDCEIYTNSKLLSDFYVGKRAEDNGINNGVTREQYEAALAAKNEGWIEWGGGECPVQEGVLVKVKYRNEKDNHIKGTNCAGRWSWEHYGTDGDIIAYRLHKQKEAEQDKDNLNERIGQDAAPVWSGEGLPPVGCVCEVLYDEHEVLGNTWLKAKIISHDDGNVVGRWLEGNTEHTLFDYAINHRDYRPLRTEADKKRDAAINAIKESYYKQDRSGNYRGEEGVFDDIAAGKIPGVKLED